MSHRPWYETSRPDVASVEEAVGGTMGRISVPPGRYLLIPVVAGNMFVHFRITRQSPGDWINSVPAYQGEAILGGDSRPVDIPEGCVVEWICSIDSAMCLAPLKLFPADRDHGVA